MCTVEGSLYKEIGCFPEGGRKAESLTCNFYRGNNTQNRCLAQQNLSFFTCCLPSSLPQERFIYNNLCVVLQNIISLAEAFLELHMHMLKLWNYSIYLPILTKTLIWKKKKKYQARKHGFKEPKIALRLVTVHKNEFLFRKKKDKCRPFNYQHLSLGQDHQVYNIEDSFNIEDRWQLHSWDLLRLPQKKEKKKKDNTKKSYNFKRLWEFPEDCKSGYKKAGLPGLQSKW